MKTVIWSDPIVAETRKWREELLQESGNDLGRLVQYLMENQRRHGDNLVSFDQSKTDTPKPQCENGSNAD